MLAAPVVLVGRIVSEAKVKIGKMECQFSMKPLEGNGLALLRNELPGPFLYIAQLRGAGT